ncbi:HPP family protein [Patescibacteria group bacterium]
MGVPVEKIMVPIKMVACLNRKMTLRQADEIFKQNGSTVGGEVFPLKGTVVLDEEGNLIGIASMKDILKIVIPRYVQGSLVGITYDEQLEDRVAKVWDTELVEDIMIEDVKVVKYNDSIMKCLEIMNEKGFQRMPVVDDEGRIIGMIYIRKLYEYVSSKAPVNGGVK